MTKGVIFLSSCHHGKMKGDDVFLRLEEWKIDE